jgi:predicted DNA repair protein MutK
MHWEVLLSAGIPPIITVAEPGVHGVVTGMQGIGVSTPKAAAVADATIGLAMDMHMAKGGMLVIGTKSMILAAGGPPAFVRLIGRTFRTEGAMPKVHIIMAPAVTCCGIGWED